MKKSCVFTVPGKVVPKQRPRKGPHGNFYTPTATKEYEDRIAYSCMKWRDTFTHGEVRVSLFFHTLNRRIDLDNAIKSVLDGIQKAGVFKNDSQVKAIAARIVEDAEERTRVVIEDHNE